MWQSTREPEQGPARISNFLLPILWLGIVNTSAKQDRETRDLFSRTKLWMQKSWIIPKLAAEVWRIWKSTRRAQQPALMPQREGIRESWRIARQQPESGGEGGQPESLWKKSAKQDMMKKIPPKRPAADSLPLFKRKSCLFYQTGRSLILGLGFLPCPPTHSPGKGCLVLEEKVIELELLTLFLKGFGCA